ncbi:hypothetical protein AB0229_10275 [Klebsiella pneumoniae]
MTNNQLTSTHLAVKSELDGYKIHASRGQATAMAMVRLFESIDRDLEELQERRKADSEPVAYMHDGEDGTEYNGHNEFSGGGKGIPLYRHAQQPVLLVAPDKMTAIVKDEAEYVEGWNACRAAMLNGGKP